MQKTKRDYRQPMLDVIVKRKNQASVDGSATITTPHITHNIATALRPNKAEVIERHTTIDFLPLDTVIVILSIDFL